MTKKRINIDELQFLSYWNENEDQKLPLSELDKNDDTSLAELSAEDQFILVKDAYIDRIKKNIKKLGIENNVKILDKYDLIPTGKTSHPHHSMYRIVVSNLIIVHSKNLSKTIFHFFYPEIEDYRIDDGIHITFEKNEFIAEDSTTSAIMDIGVSDYSNVYFIGNTFIDYFLNIYGESSDGCLIRFVNNTFKNDTTILIRTQFHRRVQDIIGCHVVMESNKYLSIVAISCDNLYFTGRNKIERLSIEDGVNYCDFGSYQIVLPKEDLEDHKRTFLKLLGKAIAVNDQHQIGALHVQIKNSERLIIKRDGINRSNFRDYVILWWGHTVSRYSSSWIRPFSWLVLSNLIFTGLVFWVYPERFNTLTALEVFLEFFNPLSSPSDVLQEGATGGIQKVLISAINLLQKLVYALLGYEIIRAFRRFTSR